MTLQQEAWRKFHDNSEHLNQMAVVYAIRLSGPLDTAALANSFAALIARHESLRARVLLDDDNPRQIIAPFREFELGLLRVDYESAHGSKSKAEEYAIGEFASRQYDLAVGPLFDVKLLRRSSTEHVVVWGVNHLAGDGASFHVMFREFWLLYRNLVRGSSTPLLTLPTRVAEYQAWQRRAHGIWQREQERDWRRHLEGTPGIRWPVDSCGAVSDRSVVAQVHVSRVAFSATLSTALRELARRARTLVSLEIATVYVATLVRWCDQPNMVIETTVDGRYHRDHRSLVGFLAHFTYLRIQLNPKDTFLDLLNQVTQEYSRALAQRDFGRLVSETPEVLAGTTFQWLPWGIDGVCGVPTPEEASEIDIAGELLPFTQRTFAADAFRFGALFCNTERGISGVLACSPRLYLQSTLEKFAAALSATAERFAKDPLAQVLASG